MARFMRHEPGLAVGVLEEKVTFRGSSLTYEKEFANNENRGLSKFWLPGGHHTLFSGRSIATAGARFFKPSFCIRVSTVHTGDVAGAGCLVSSEPLDASHPGASPLP